MDPLYLIEKFWIATGSGRQYRDFAEPDRNRTRRNVVEEIAEGQHDLVIKVLEVHEGDGAYRAGQVFDVTADIADAVSARLYGEGVEPTYDVLTFLQANGLRQYASAAE